MGTLNNGLEIQWLGHATFRVKSPGGKTVLIDPWVQQNPACPEQLKNVEQADVMAVTHGHFDHIADAVELGKKLKPTVICIYETSVWLAKKGVENLIGMNKGGTVEAHGIKFTMVHADHSCGIQDDDGSIVYGGDPCGYVITFENGYKIYHAGDTNVFSDMRLIHDLYHPELVMIPIGDLYTMSPHEASFALRFLQPKYCIPMHYGTFPPLTGTPDQLREKVKDLDVQILAMKPGDILT